MRFCDNGRFSGYGVVIAKRNTLILVEGHLIGSLGITAVYVFGKSVGFPMPGANVDLIKKDPILKRCFMYTVKEYSDWNIPLFDPVNSIPYTYRMT